MPILLPILRIRLYVAVPSARNAGVSVEKVSALSGTNTRPRPKPWITPGQTMSDADSTIV